MSTAHERIAAGKQNLARLALGAFREQGQRGVMVVHLTRVPPFKPRIVYNVMTTDDGSAAAQMVRHLVTTYDPTRQAVLFFLDVAGHWQGVEIVDIETRH